MKFLAFMRRVLWFLCVPSVLCGLISNCLALDREAFTITNYDLSVRIEPDQHRLGVRGKITLRNDTQIPQKIAVLQISSSLDWKSITLTGKNGAQTLQFVRQPLTSDIDHTGSLSEAIVTLPQAIAPKGTIDLEIGYEGTIVLDATRLTRIGIPEREAEHTDWDQIARDSVAIRGAGYVAWYPIATEVANLSEDNSLFDVLGRWETREASVGMQLRLSTSRLSGDHAQDIFIDQTECAGSRGDVPTEPSTSAECKYQGWGPTAPPIVIAEYSEAETSGIQVYLLPWDSVSGAVFVDAASGVEPLIRDWFGASHKKATVLDIPDENAAPFENGSLLLMPIRGIDLKLAGLVAAHQLTHASFFSVRPWINEGLAHFAQALYLEHAQNRPVALVYMGLHTSAFLEAEKRAALKNSSDTNSLINTTIEDLYRSKAMCVWWMLRDMIGDAALKKALAAYRPEQDNDPTYMPRLIAAQTQRDLEWFFDNWVYHDHGLPDFKIESVFPTKTATDTYMVTVTIDNLGLAGAEVPVIISSTGADVVKRVEVRGKSKATIRVETPARPFEVVVNDGSVPESDTTNNVFKLETTEK
jgi:hypothetical protein